MTDRAETRPPEHESCVVSARQLARLRTRIVALAAAFWGEALGAPGPEVEAAARAFFALYPERPVPDNSGGSGYADSFWIYTAARLLRPRLIVESGAFRGQTGWLLRRACPAARLWSVDVDLGQLRYRDPSIAYHEGDWMDAPLGDVDPASSLAFFDDHVSQALRVRQAHARGFRTLLFDDDLPAENLYVTGEPPVPTISMVLDGDLQPGERIEWLRRGRPHHYVVDAADLRGARRLIRSRHVTPDLTPILRQRLQGGLTFVRLGEAPA